MHVCYIIINIFIQLSKDKFQYIMNIFFAAFMLIKKVKYLEEDDIAQHMHKEKIQSILLLFTQETIRLPNNSCWVATRQSGGAQRIRRRRRIQSSWGRAGCNESVEREGGREERKRENQENITESGRENKTERGYTLLPISP